MENLYVDIGALISARFQILIIRYEDYQEVYSNDIFLHIITINKKLICL